MLVALTTLVGATGNLDWKVSVDSTIVRVHQRGARTAKVSAR
ncbi:hypothetical protein [Nocardia neocaledoniensis]|nr:hypothetical protein [Nocardia neocaledoniensis]